MAFRTAGNRRQSKSRSPVDKGDRNKGVKLTLNTDLSVNGKLNGEASSFKPAVSAIDYLRHGSTPDGPLIVSSEKHAATQKAIAAGKAVPTPIGTQNGISPTRGKIIFTTDIVPGKFLGSHYVKLQVSKDMYMYLFDEMHSAFDWSRNVRNFLVMPETEGKRMTAYAVFDDVRRADKAHANVNMVDTTADVDYVTQSEFAAAQREIQTTQSRDAAGPSSSFYDGQVMFYAQLDGQLSASKATGLKDQIRSLAQQFGDVMVIGELDAKNGMARYRVEYHSIRAAKDAVAKLTPGSPADIDGWLVTAQEIPDINSASNSDKGTGAAGRCSTSGTTDDDTFVSPTGRTAWFHDPATGEMLPAGKDGSDRTSSLNGGLKMMHPVRRYSPPVQLPCNTLHGAATRQGPIAMQPYNANAQIREYQYLGGARRNEYGCDNSQVVDPDNIRNGTDVRTTLMLRNLPNSFTCHTLKALLDKSNFGEYDFSYVRIDYEKGSSVGYGFVNFTHPEAILSFLHHYAGRPWMPELANRRGAARLAEVSYATIQGWECCVEKFRNSSVMTEYPDYCPKLWHTKASAPSEDMVGEPVPFPPVNNMTKHQRSLDNAKQVGLFPSSGRRGPGPQYRPIRSQFDRGTTAQQQEDMMHHIQQMQQQQQLMQSGNFNGGHLLPAGQPAFPMPHTVPMTPQAGLFGVIGYDSFGNSIFGNTNSMMPGFYNQMPPNVAPMLAAPMNGNSFAGNPAGNARMPVRGAQGGHRAVAPRAYRRYDADEDPNTYQDDFNFAAMTGYHNPMAQKKKDGE